MKAKLSFIIEGTEDQVRLAMSDFKDAYSHSALVMSPIGDIREGLENAWLTSLETELLETGSIVSQKKI